MRSLIANALRSVGTISFVGGVLLGGALIPMGVLLLVLVYSQV